MIIFFLCAQLLTRELAQDGYAGVEVRVVPLRTEIIIRATQTQKVLGEKGQRIRELTSVIQKRCVGCLDWRVRVYHYAVLVGLDSHVYRSHIDI